MKEKSNKHINSKTQNLYSGVADMSTCYMNKISNINTAYSNFANNLQSINELSNGLSLAITDKISLGNYQNVLKSQNLIAGQFNNIQGQLNLKPSAISDFTNHVITPLSAAIADTGLLMANVKQGFDFKNINQPILDSTRKLSNICLDAVQGQQEILAKNLKGIESLEEFNSFNKAISTNIQTVSNGLIDVINSNPIYPQNINLPSLRSVKENAQLTDNQKTEYQKRLDDILSDIDEDLVEYRIACWQTFNRKGEDYIGQAVSSMRRLVDNTLWKIAPKEKVAKTKYYRNNKEAKGDNGRPTRKARIYYIFRYDENQASHLEKLARGFLESYDSLPEWDHKPLKNDSFVLGVLTAIEGSLLSLLTEWVREK